MVSSTQAVRICHGRSQVCFIVGRRHGSEEFQRACQGRFGLPGKAISAGCEPGEGSGQTVVQITLTGRFKAAGNRGSSVGWSESEMFVLGAVDLILPPFLFRYRLFHYRVWTKSTMAWQRVSTCGFSIVKLGAK